MVKISNITAREIIDSRGNPTTEVDVTLEDGSFGRAAVPSGASTGTHEAVELRDGDISRYLGKGVQKAIKAVNGEINNLLASTNGLDQNSIDRKMIDLDGTENKSRLGANAILGVSLACAKAAANHAKMPLYRYIGNTNANLLPVPMMNVINGGQHANNPIDIQEFMIAPVGADNIVEAIRIGAEVFHHLRSLLIKQNYSVAVGDEGGFAPELSTTNQALDIVCEAIIKAGYEPAKDIYLALDCAATEYYQNGVYVLAGENAQLNKEQNVAFLEKLVNDYPIYSIEDGCSEDDWQGWQLLTKTLGDRVQLVGDDLFVTNINRINQGIEQECANAVLIKVNQIGTLTETIEAVKTAHNAGMKTVMSHRSGETEDTTIADLAVALNCGQIKTGSLSRSERLAKYNQLIRINENLGQAAKYAGAMVIG